MNAFVKSEHLSLAFVVRFLSSVFCFHGRNAAASVFRRALQQVFGHLPELSVIYSGTTYSGFVLSLFFLQKFLVVLVVEMGLIPVISTPILKVHIIIP
jgi:hypothetical protein